MEIVLFSALFFVVAIVLAFLAVFITWRLMERKEEAVEPELQIFKEENVSSIFPFATLLRRFDIIDVIRTRTEQAGLGWSAGRTLAAMLLAGTISFVAFQSFAWIPGVVDLLFSVGFAALPYAYILQRRSRRMDAFETQFPDALEAIIRGLRAGHPFGTSMEIVAAEEMGPVTAELRRTIDEWKLGRTWSEALDHMAERVPTTDVGVFVAAVKLQMRTGGRLSEVLLKLAESMRENVAIRGEVRALSAQGKLTGTVLTLLPVGLGLILYTVNPDQIGILFQDPGRQFVLICAGLLVLAHFIIRRIVDVRL